jgi:hypothetical protein
LLRVRESDGQPVKPLKGDVGAAVLGCFTLLGSHNIQKGGLRRSYLVGDRASGPRGTVSVTPQPLRSYVAPPPGGSWGDHIDWRLAAPAPSRHAPAS